MSILKDFLLENETHRNGLIRALRCWKNNEQRLEADCESLRLKLIETAQELKHMIDRENARISGNITSSDETEPDYIDYQTVHEAMTLASKCG